MIHLLWLVVLLPFAGSIANAILGPRVPRRRTTAVGVGIPAVTAALALGIIGEYITGVHPGVFQQSLYTWSAGEFAVDVAFRLDALSAVMLFVVTFVGFWIHFYSASYMAEERGYQRYFVYLNLFLGAMLLLILGANYLVLFVGWEGVGLCSYLLIGFDYEEEFPPRAGRKAFVVNRIGDFAFLLGMFALVDHFSTLDFGRIFAEVGRDPEILTEPYVLGLSFVGFVCLALFLGAVGKSAQIPLHVWLPDAMAGPTPVSALIHAATMVTAGVYMVARSSPLYQHAPSILGLVAAVGTVTAIFAATIAITKTDIKKVLAYSTVSQLGYMFLAAGLGAYAVAIFHVLTHAFFKALLFLGSGSVIHAMGGEQDMGRMGGLKKQLPVTYWTFLIASLAIAGIPPLSGFFSKDMILAAAWGSSKLFWCIALFTAGLTACYMLRVVILTFHGEFRGTPEEASHLHESPAVMRIPLVVLAIGSVVAGWIWLPRLGGLEFQWLSTFLAPALTSPAHGSGHHPSQAVEILLIGASVLAALLGFLVAWRTWGRRRGPDGASGWVQRFPAIHRLLIHNYYVDEIYDRCIVRPLAGIARFCWRIVDALFIDRGLAHAGPFLAQLTGDLGRFTTTGNVRNYALYFFLGILAMIWWVLF